MTEPAPRPYTPPSAPRLTPGAIPCPTALSLRASPAVARPRISDRGPTGRRRAPTTWRFDIWAVVRIVERVFGQWVRGQLILGLAAGVATFIGLGELGVVVNPVFGRYAVLLSVIAGILELVPIIGPIISAVPAVLLAATAGIESVIAAFMLYMIIQQVENNFLVPKIQGDAVELHPAPVIVAIIIGGALAGLIGAILALPMTARSATSFDTCSGGLVLMLPTPSRRPSMAWAWSATRVSPGTIRRSRRAADGGLAT